MMLFLLWRVLVEPLPASNVELQLYGDPEDLPAHWAKALPQGFDFSRERLATRASFEQNVELLKPRKQSQHRELLLLWPSRPPAQEAPRCPPCNGIQMRDDAALRPPLPTPAGPPLALYRVPRTVTRAFELYDEREMVALPPCPPCRAP